MQKISVLIPTYNRSQMLPESIDSILKQTHTNLNIIIYDDGSTDETPKVMKSYHDHRIQYIRSEENLGVQNARNALLEAATTDIACWQDSDDISNIYRIEKQLQYLKDNNKIMVGTNYIGFADKVEKKHDIKVVTPNEARRMAVEQPEIHKVEKVKYPHGCFASTMFYCSKAVDFNLSYSFGMGDTVWLKEMQKTHHTDRLIMPDILYFVRYHPQRIGRWKKNKELNPKWLKRMRKISKR